MAAYLRDHQDKVVDRWTELVVTGLRGRSSATEVKRELEDLYTLVVRAMSGADEQAAGELRATLAELSRARARNGFTPGETALGVFALKDAVYELVADAADLVAEYLVFSRMMDDLGLHTFETYAAAREQIIADQAAAMLELSTPVIRLWQGIIAVPLVGTLDSARTQLVMEKLLDTLVATGADHAASTCCPASTSTCSATPTAAPPLPTSTARRSCPAATACSCPPWSATARSSAPGAAACSARAWWSRRCPSRRSRPPNRQRSKRRSRPTAASCSGGSRSRRPSSQPPIASCQPARTPPKLSRQSCG